MNWNENETKWINLINFWSKIFLIQKNLLLFHEFSGVLISTRFRIDSAKLDVIKKHRTMPATKKLYTRFCAIFDIQSMWIDFWLEWHKYLCCISILSCNRFKNSFLNIAFPVFSANQFPSNSTAIRFHSLQQKRK